MLTQILWPRPGKSKKATKRGESKHLGVIVVVFNVVICCLVLKEPFPISVVLLSCLDFLFLFPPPAGLLKLLLS